MKTDTKLQQDVSAELRWEPSVKAAQIGVTVSDGVVTLSGHVSSFLQKWNAEKAALRVIGVRALAVEIDVQLTPLGQRTDADIALAAETALEWLASASREKIKIMVENGWMTLSGCVQWQFERNAAEEAIRHLVGVRGVSNQISIEPSITAITVQAEIEAALTRHAHIDARNIRAYVSGTSVTLSGTVKSWVERESATQAAWCMPGVRDVVDHMILSF